MSGNRRGWKRGLATLLLAVLFGCAAVPTPPGVPPASDSRPAPKSAQVPGNGRGPMTNGHAPSPVGVRAGSNQVRMVVRDFLPPATAPDRDYQFYSYLLFTSRSQSGYRQREAAALAFMCEFADVGAALDLNLKKSELAVFYAPVRGGSDLPALRRSQSAGALLAAYDYSHAELLASRLGGRFGAAQMEVSIVASPRPLALLTDAQLDQVQVLSLTGRPPAHVARVISRFRELVKRPVECRDPPAAGVGAPCVPVLAGATDLGFPEHFRALLGSLGSLVGTIAPEARADDVACH